MFLDHKEIIKLGNSKTINVTFTTEDFYTIDWALGHFKRTMLKGMGKSETAQNKKTANKINRILDAKYNQVANIKWDRNGSNYEYEEQARDLLRRSEI